MFVNTLPCHYTLRLHHQKTVPSFSQSGFSDAFHGMQRTPAVQTNHHMLLLAFARQVQPPNYKYSVKDKYSVKVCAFFRWSTVSSDIVFSDRSSQECSSGPSFKESPQVDTVELWLVAVPHAQIGPTNNYFSRFLVKFTGPNAYKPQRRQHPKPQGSTACSKACC